MGAGPPKWAWHEGTRPQVRVGPACNSNYHSGLKKQLRAHYRGLLRAGWDL